MLSVYVNMKSTFKLTERLSGSGDTIDRCESIFIVKIIGVKGIFHLPEERDNTVEDTGYSD